MPTLAISSRRPSAKKTPQSLMTQSTASPIIPAFARVTNEQERNKGYEIIDAYFARMKEGSEHPLSEEEYRHFHSVAKAIQHYEKMRYPLQSLQESLLQGFSIGEWDAQRLKAFRKEFSLTQVNIAEFLGVKQSRVAEMESGNHAFSQTTRIALDRITTYIREEINGQ